MSQVVKTFTAEQSFHEMLIRAQALSPVLTYIMCWLLLHPKEDQDCTVTVRSICVPHEMSSFSRRFHKQSGEMSLFVESIFQGYVVHVGSEDVYWNDCFYMRADTEFVAWLKSGVITMDDEKKLLTINQ